MSCAICGHENPTDNRFCGGCGAPLERRCPSCQHGNPPDHRFCGGCGASLGVSGVGSRVSEKTQTRRDTPHPTPDPRSYTPKHLADKILQSKSALEGERKQVTVLFADVKGSMELAEQLDPEEWHTILDRFFQILTDGVHRFEGTVNQYTGDGIMALFGAPIAHEDHAQRACYAALQLLEDLRNYAREVKRTHGLDFAVRIGVHSGAVVVGKIGDDLRMDYTAQGQTVGLAQRMEGLAEANTCFVTGTTAALVAGYFALDDLGPFRVKGVAEPVAVFVLRGLGAVRTRFDASRARGLTHFVGRDADMRTLEAALEQAQAGHGQVVGVVAEAGTGKSRLCFEFTERCRARDMTIIEGQAVAHGKNIPLLPMLQVFRAYYGISERDDDRTVREKIAGRLLLLDDSFRDVLPVMFDFFGVPDPERPVARMDPDARQRQLFAVLRQLVQRDDPSGRQYITLIEDLHWMDPASEAFLVEWVDAIGSASRLLVVNFRPEYHAGWMQKSYYRRLPLAPLGPEAIRKLLEDLLGSDPSTRGLADAIHARTGGNPFFTEEVVQTLIESGNLQGTRGAYRLGLWMRDVARSFEHFERVRTLTTSLLDDAEGRDHGLRARIMLLQASWRVGLSGEQIDPLAVEARQIAARQGDARSRLDVEAALMPAYWLTGKLAEAAEIGQAAVQPSDALGEVMFRTLVRSDLAHIYISSGRLNDAAGLFDEALEIGGDDPNIGMERVGLALQVWARSRRGWAHIEMGRLALGVADLEVGARRARELTQWEVASWTLMFHVFADEYAGNPADTALRRARESLEYAERAGSPFAQATAYYALGRAHLAAKDSAAAREAFERVQALPLSADFEPNLLALLAEAQLGTGDGEVARATADQAMRLAQERGTRGWEVRAHLAQARVLRALDGVSAKTAIEACLARAEALVTETGARAQTPFLIEERARLAMDLGDARDRARLLHEAQRAFEEMGAAGHAARLAAVLAAGEGE